MLVLARASQSAATELHHNQCSSNNSGKPHAAAILVRAQATTNLMI